MTDEQKAVLRQQVQRYQQAQRVAAQEGETLRQMLTLLDARFADPESGLEFDTQTLEIRTRSG